MVSCPSIGHDREKSVSLFFGPPQQALKHIGKILTEPSLLQDELSQLSHPPLVCQVLLALHNLPGHLPHSHLSMSISPLLGSPDMDPALQG